VNSLSANRIKNGDRDKIIVSGSLSQNSNEVVIYKSISNPTIWSGDHLKEFLNQRGIKVKGNVKRGVCASNSQVLATVQSKNFSEMIADMLKFSNNFVAEMLVKNLAADDLEAKNSKKSATMKEGIELLKNYLTTLGIDKKNYTLVNVSGLTRENQLTAIHLAKVLSHVKNNFQIFPEFTAGLPIAGVDGTMKNRLKGDEGKWVRAKTGYLDGIIGLAGYIGRPNKEPLVFVMMFNGGFDQGLAARPLFDEMIKQLQK
jgi:D-alanyl-D-alanine carboxypeptidase/D-alanyl-D-alanine-endopeptidase (penicillin-binding protein 4)